MSCIRNTMETCPKTFPAFWFYWHLGHPNTWHTDFPFFRFLGLLVFSIYVQFSDMSFMAEVVVEFQDWKEVKTYHFIKIFKVKAFLLLNLPFKPDTQDPCLIHLMELEKNSITQTLEGTLKPNYFKNQCSSSSFLLIWSRYTGPKWPWSLIRLVPCLKWMELGCQVLLGHFGPVYLLREDYTDGGNTEFSGARWRLKTGHFTTYTVLSFEAS